ncbi:MAG: hypothetical protein IPM80_24075 [Proteobacteria bacterium]|nr:hypothetical protein [Pseudomonadota bacterium]
MTTKRTWMVRAGRDAHAISEFREKGVVAVGWGQLRPLNDFVNREAIEKAIAESRPDLSPKQRLNAASQHDPSESDSCNPRLGF